MAELDLAALLPEDSGASWLVGGTIRDRLLDRRIFDYDIVIEGDPAAAARTIARRLKASPFSLSDRFGSWRVVAPDKGWQIDITGLRGPDLDSDLGERDFTINAIAEPLAGGPLIDPFDGVKDLRKRRIRMVSSRALHEDGLRVLRAVRLAHELGFTIESDTAQECRLAGPLLADVAGERIFSELKRLMASRDPGVAVRRLAEIDIWTTVFPELAGVDIGDICASLDAVVGVEERLIKSLDSSISDRVSTLLREPLADEVDRSTAMRFAALFVSANARAALRRLHSSTRVLRYVVTLTAARPRAEQLLMHQPTKQAIWRHFIESEPYSCDALLFAYALTPPNIDDSTAAQLFDELQTLDRAGRPSPLIRGDDLAQALSIPGGPALGRLLDQLAEEQFVGTVTSRDDAIGRAHELLEANSTG